MFFSVIEANACLNFYYSIDNKGHLHPAEDREVGFNTNFNLKRIEAKLIALKKELKEENDYKLLSDYAVLLLKAGKTQDALDILIQLSKHYPDEYQIAANLGTAYELSGNNKKALQFIKRGMELNPDSHEGSEWVHLNVLETKLNMVNDSLYLSKHSVLNLSEEDKKDSLIRQQIMIQVRERFPFSPGPNQIMASIITDLGDCYANTASIEFAKTLYTIAKKYYGANEELVDAKIDEMERLKRKFSSIRPERRREVGDNVRRGRISYNRMLDNNNKSNYEINWDKILTNSDTLLSYAKLTRIEDVMEPLVEEAIDSSGHGSENKEKDITEAEQSDTVYYLIAILLAILAGYLLYKKRSANKN